VLLDLAENVDGKRIIHKAPPKQEIAHMIGASREMVSRVMKDLQNSGHVRIDKRRIVLLDSPGGAVS
jgi:CRP/FNR family cyclic AMP-dependent transcriptional regulator